VNRILLALDQTAGATGLLKRARLFARARHSDLWVVHVLRPRAPGERAPDILRDLDNADRWLADLLRRKTHPERPMVVMGDPAHEIAATAKFVGADAIIVGSRPRTRPRNGDATGARVVELSACPVLRLATFPAAGSVG